MERLEQNIVELKRDEVLDEIRQRIESGDDPLRIIEECKNGILQVGKLFEAGEYFLAELMLSAELFKNAFEILQPYLSKTKEADSLGKVVIATPKGDIHDLGKNIVSTLLRAHGFTVYDLGVDVDPDVIVKKIKEIKPSIVGFSALITSAFDSMKEVSNKLEADGLRDDVKLIIGGGVTDHHTKEYIGADFQTTDAVAGLNYCLNLVKDK